jgi:hypothetical protein
LALRRIGLLFALALSVGALSAPAANAANAEQAEDLIRQGLDLRQAGQDGRALPFFRKAYEGERTPRTAGQLGLCELALGYWVDAEGHLGEALASSGNPWVEKNRPTLARSLDMARGNIGNVSVMGGPAGAKVFLDNREVGALPLDRPLRLSKGPHDIEVRAPGPVTRSKTMVVQGGDEQTVTLVLEAAPVPVPIPRAAPPTLVSEAPASAPAKGGRPVAAWIAGGTAVAALAVGAAETVIWLNAVDKFDNHIGVVSAAQSSAFAKNCGSADPNYGGPGCAALHDDITNARLFALVGYGVGVVAAAGALYLFTTASPPDPKTGTALSCAPNLGGVGLSCRMTF